MKTTQLTSLAYHFNRLEAQRPEERVMSIEDRIEKLEALKRAVLLLIREEKAVKKMMDKDTSNMSIKGRQNHEMRLVTFSESRNSARHEAHCRAVEAGIADPYPDDYYGDQTERPTSWHEVNRHYPRPNI